MNSHHPASLFLVFLLSAACGASNTSSTGAEGGALSETFNAATAGGSCGAGTTNATNQPENPCEAGYIWSCDFDLKAWFKELVQCQAGMGGGVTTAGCAAGEVLFVADPNADEPAHRDDAGALLEYAETAYCIPIPSSCSGSLDCECASATCASPSLCGAGGSCIGAAAGVIDCSCP